jgi:hypothetical protein
MEKMISLFEDNFFVALFDGKGHLSFIRICRTLLFFFF